MSFRSKGLSDDEERWVAEIAEALEAARDHLEDATGPSDELVGAGVMNVLDDVEDARRKVEHALRRLRFLRNESVSEG